MPAPDRRSILSFIGLSALPAFASSARAQGMVRHLPLKTSEGLHPNLVTLTPARFQDRDGMAVALTEPAQAALLTPGAAGNGPSFAMPELNFASGTIEVELAARINGRGQPDVRGFVGLAFHIADDLGTFEAVYLRMTNGSRNAPPPPAPRNAFAVQYISFPDRYWRRLRQEHPNRYEQPAPVAIETWHRLRLDIRGSRLQAFVDGESVLTVTDLGFPDRPGRVGLWVDDGTTGYFRDLRVTAA